MINDQSMNPSEYLQAKKYIANQKEKLEDCELNNPLFKKEFQKYTEMLITIKGHAWCMDVVSERRKMAKLVTSAIVEFDNNKNNL